MTDTPNDSNLVQIPEGLRFEQIGVETRVSVAGVISLSEFEEFYAVVVNLGKKFDGIETTVELGSVGLLEELCPTDEREWLTKTRVMDKLMQQPVPVYKNTAAKVWYAIARVAHFSEGEVEYRPPDASNPMLINSVEMTSLRSYAESTDLTKFTTIGQFLVDQISKITNENK